MSKLRLRKGPNRTLKIDSSLADTYEEEAVESRKKGLGRSIKSLAKKCLPFLSWVPLYKKGYFLADLLAGITVWLTAVPQAMAYGIVSGVSPEYGLYTLFVGPFVYILLGSMRQVSMGPTAVLALTTHQICGEDFPECVILLSFYAGFVEIVLGILNLGVIISFISEPVTVGFTAGSAFTIASSQVKSLLGLGGKPDGDKFIDIWKHVFTHLDTISVGDAVMGISCCILLLALRKFKEVRLNLKSHPKFWNACQRWFCLARNAIAVIVSTVIAYLWGQSGPFNLTGEVQSGLPPVQAPDFTLYDRQSNATEPMTFTETLAFMGSGPVVIAIISILQNVAISKIYGSGQTVDGTQEMIALGAANTIGAFFSAVPTSGSFSRSAVNESSGVKSQFGGFYLGTLVLLTLWFLTPSFQYIPKSSLAAVIVCAVIFMIEWDTIFQIWKISKIDFVSFTATFIASLLLGMEFGIAVGVGVSVAFLLLRSLRPTVPLHLLKDKVTQVKYVLLTPDQGFFFPSVDYVRDCLQKFSQRYEDYPVMVIQCDKWTHWDYTSLTTMTILAKTLAKTGKTLVLFRASPSWTEAVEGLEGPKKLICCPKAQDLHKFFQEFVGPSKKQSVTIVDQQSHLDTPFEDAGNGNI